MRRLFERLLELEPEARARRLAELDSAEPEVARDVAALIAADGAASKLLDDSAVRFLELLDSDPAARDDAD